MWMGRIIAAEASDAAAVPPTQEAEEQLQKALAWAKALATPEKADKKKKGEKSVSTANPQYFKILSCKFTRLYYLILSRMPAHYRSGRDLKMKTVIARQDRNMGVSPPIYWEFLSCLTGLQLAASMLALSWKGYETCATRLATAPRDLKRWDVTGLEEIDNLFARIFGEFGDSSICIGTNSKAYRNALIMYAQGCHDIAKLVAERMANAGQPSQATLCTDIKAALAWPGEENPTTIPYPLPTRRFLAWIFALFASIQTAINEVSSFSLSLFVITAPM